MECAAFCSRITAIFSPHHSQCFQPGVVLFYLLIRGFNLHIFLTVEPLVGCVTNTLMFTSFNRPQNAIDVQVLNSATKMKQL